MKKSSLGLLLLGLVLMTMLVSACSQKSSTPIAGLIEESSQELQQWRTEERLTAQGEGNVYRVLKGGSASERYLELAAGGQGVMEYTLEELASEAVLAQWRLQFLSTQGTGRLVFYGLDEKGQVLAQVGMVVTGALPQNSLTAKWLDMRYDANYKGTWLEGQEEPRQILQKHLSPQVVEKVKKYRIALQTGQGQHVLLQTFKLEFQPGKAVTVVPMTEALQASIGDELAIKAEVKNTSTRAVSVLAVNLVEPYGRGIVTDTPTQEIDKLEPGESRIVTWMVKALRADGVNKDKPWNIAFGVNGIKKDKQVRISIADPRPGKVFYVMTEDLEPMDSAGYPIAWGNGNGWLDAEEFQVQMIQKAEALNQIAEQHGAKWTHYIAWPAVKAAEWAAGQSSSGQWPKVIEGIKESVRTQAGKGHEYGLHMHSDYDPYLAGNVLSYNAKTDGFWANHLRHGWAHSLAAEGNFNDYQSRAGTLYAYQKILDELASNSPQGQILTSRAGSFDFGTGSKEEAMSTRVYRNVGLWGSTDADGNEGGITSGEYGKEIYFTAEDDINHPAESMEHFGLVEFRPTPRKFIGYDGQSAAVMNQKADEGMQAFVSNEKVKPGVHGIIGFTHAMFVMGDGDWRSTQGGQFAQLDSHLAYLQHTYQEKGLLQFGTASDLVRAYLDYYTPEVMALYGKKTKEGMLSTHYELQLLGSDILVDAKHPQTVSVKYPLYLRESTYRIVILKNGQPIYSTWGLPTPYNDVRFTVDDKQAQYTMEVYHQPVLFKIVTFAKKWKKQ